MNDKIDVNWRITGNYGGGIVVALNVMYQVHITFRKYLRNVIVMFTVFLVM